VAEGCFAGGLIGMLLQGNRYILCLLLLGGGLIAAARAEPGRDWVRATAAAPWSARWGHTSVAYAGRIWVIGGGEGGQPVGDVWCSSDGTHWTAPQPSRLTRATARYGHSSVVFAGKMWLMGGYKGWMANDVWYSTNGTTWTQATAHAQWSPRWEHASVVYNGKMWVIGGGSNNDVWYSTNGTTWTQATAHALWPAGWDYRSVVYDDKLWVIGPGAWYSTDGVTWTEAIRWGPWSGYEVGLGAVVCDRRMWVMGGLMNPFYNAKASDVWYSKDGKNWTEATRRAPWQSRQNFGLVVYDRKMWILGGMDRSGAAHATYLNDVWYSQFPADAAPAWKLYP